jgi:hypothetical protein
VTVEPSGWIWGEGVRWTPVRALGGALVQDTEARCPSAQTRCGYLRFPVLDLEQLPVGELAAEFLQLRLWGRVSSELEHEPLA